MESLAGSGNLTTSATSQEVMSPRRGRRVAYSISNYGATPAYLSLSDTQAAAVGYGITLAAGATISDSNGADYKCWQGKISAVDNGAGGATTLSYWERVEL